MIKNFFGKITRMIVATSLAATVIVTSASPCSADSFEIDNSVVSIENSSIGSLIGESDKNLYIANNKGSNNLIKSIGIPNILTVDWKASSTQIFIYVENIGIDSVDSFTGTVKVTNGSSKSFAAYKLKAGKTRTITVNLNMVKCYEDINVSYIGKDGKNEIASNTSHGHREIPSYLKNVWNRGTFSSVDDSINYHFRTHHNDTSVNAADIQTFAQKAYSYKNKVVRDKIMLTQAQLLRIYYISKGTGRIPSHKYKNKTNYQFVLLSDSGNYILSYGGK